MKKTLLVMLLSIMSIVSYSQTGGLKLPGKVYLKSGEIKEGKTWINDSRFRVAGIGIKGGKYMKEVNIKPQGGKKEKIGIDQIEKIEFDRSTKKQTKFITYVPITVSEELILSREIVPNKLYGVNKVRGFTTMGNQGGVDQSQREVYYIKKGGKYEKTTLAAIKKETNCSMEEGKGREEKIAKCLQGK